MINAYKSFLVLVLLLVGGWQAATGHHRLLAGELGIDPVPGGSVSTRFTIGSPRNRDGSCWCQPINQFCTELRPENLDFVTQGDAVNIAESGLPGIPNPEVVSSCTSEQRACCPSLHASFLNQLNPNHFIPLSVRQQQPQHQQHQQQQHQQFSIQNILNHEAQTGGFPNKGFPNDGFSNRRLSVEGSPAQRNSVNRNFQQRQCGTRRSFNVYSGISPTADFGEYPWMAVILDTSDTYVAGGVVIADNWVLTAPHALSKRSGLKVRLGDYDVGEASEVPQFPHFEVSVTRVIIHRGFNRKTLANDVALLQLAQHINRQQYPHITPACLPFQGQSFNNQRCYVTGWGKDAFGPGNFQRKLQEVDVPLIEGNRCQDMFRRTRLGRRFVLNQRSFLCAGGEKDKDSCEGDGGSPLVCENGNRGWTVVGLVAWGIGCAQENVPAAYINVASYVNFINQHVH